MGKLIVANWKENPETEQDALKLFAAMAKIPRGAGRGGVDIVVCPPFVYLEPIADAFRALRKVRKNISPKNLALGGQDIFWERTGAFTGEIGPTMLRSLGARYAIIGHSERRKFLNETDEMVNKKVRAALKAGLKVILCVGEPLAVRKQGTVAALRFVKDQLEKDLRGLRHGIGLRHVIIAYEPIWAIGTGKNARPDDALTMARFIKKALQTSVLYGGSVNGKDVRDYLQYKEIGGVLVGGASLDAKEFAKIVKFADSLPTVH